MIISTSAPASAPEAAPATEAPQTAPVSAAQMLQAAIDAANKPSEAQVEPASTEGTTAGGPAAEPVVEQKAEEKTEEPAKPKIEVPKDDKFSQKFAALSRKEKAISAREKAIEAREAEIAKLKADTEATSGTQKTVAARLKTEPLKVLEEAGLTFKQLAEIIVNDGKLPQDMAMDEHSKAVQAKIDALEKKLADKEEKEQQERLDATMQSFLGELTDFVNTEKDYELIRANDGVGLVYEVIENYHSETGKILSNKEACDAVEEHLLGEAKRHLGLDKIKKLVEPPPTPKAIETPRQAPKTLSNAQVTQAAPATGKRYMSDEESRREAAKLIKWD